MLLLIDDDDDFRESLAEFLIFRGYAVQTAESVGSALHLSKVLSPELILLDLSMPVIDGWDFLRERRKDPQLARIPIIVISGSFGVDHRAREAGASEVIKKPFDPNGLLPIIDQFLAAA
jgi:two-component system cell cycle response regulator DivK